MLELRNVSGGYGRHTVLRDVNLVVPDNAVVALLGANGAGKTTLLRIASGMLPARSGELLLDGVDVTRWPAYRLARSGVCHVPEGRGIFRALSVRDNLRLGAPRSADLRAIPTATQAFPLLGERLAQQAGTLSGGEQRMLALARPLLAKSRMILLDEVSIGLAPKVVDLLFEHLHSLAAGGASLLLVEQYVSRALELADYAYILRKGRIIFAGEPKQLTSERVLVSYLGETASV
jgi:branched-chain amino acid transport system ATP-binding protein